MLLPWELLILLSLKECLAGEMPSQVAFHDTPDMHTSFTGGVHLCLMRILVSFDHSIKRDHNLISFYIWAKSATTLVKTNVWPNL